MSRLFPYKSALRCQRLEDRLAPANLHIAGVSLVDAYGISQSAPMIGQMIYVQTSYTTSGMAGGEQFLIRSTVDGVSADSATITAVAGGGSFVNKRGGWYATSGVHTLAATVDGANTVVESNESDNSTSTQITTVVPSNLQSIRFVRPIGYTPNSDWAISNYSDIDPRAGVGADYRGGIYQSDSHVGLDYRTFGFDRMDAGIPIIAAADGTITEVVDGNYDRNNAANSNAGNSIRIDHGGEWETRYDHLMRNSITVQPGDVVKAGQLIGLMGSSGNSLRQHLHFTLLYRGCEIETGYDPATYQTHPIAYAGDVTPFIFDAGVSNYDPLPDILERVSPLNSYSTSQTGSIYSWARFYNAKSSDTLTWNWYRPNGTLGYSSSMSPTTSRFSWWWFSRPVSQFASSPGVWQVAQSINGVEATRTSFTVASGAATPAVKFTDSADRILLDERSTPVDFGSVAKNATAPILAFNIVNHGGAALSLSNYVLPLGFTFVDTLPASVAANSVIAIGVQLDTAVVGDKFGTFQVDTNDPLAPRYNFNLSGTVTGSPASNTPTINLSVPYALAYEPLDLAKALAPAAILTASLSATIQSLRVEFASNGRSQDRLGVRHEGNGAGQIGVTGATVTYGGVVLGTFTGGTSLAPLDFILNSSATAAKVQALIRNITFDNTDANPGTAPRYVRFTVVDSSNRQSNMPIKNVTVSEINRRLAGVDLPPSSITRGVTLNQSSSFDHLTGANWVAMVNYGDGSGVHPVTLNPNNTFTLSHMMTGGPGDLQSTFTLVNDQSAVSSTTTAVTVIAPIQVAATQVDDGSAQRSIVRHLTVNFTRAVGMVDPGAFTLTPSVGGPVTLAITFNAARTSATLTFPGRSLADALYTLSLDGSKFHDDTQGTLDGNGDGLSGGNFNFAFHRLFGDINGDRTVNAVDFIRMRQVFCGFDFALDHDGDGNVAANDFVRFRANFGHSV